LIYAVSYVDTPANFRARFSMGAIGAFPNDNLAMLRQRRKTEIYSVSMTDGKSSLLFSDEGMNFEVIPVHGLGYPVVTRGKALVKGVEWSWRGQPRPGAMATPQGAYEISLDGSNRFRRLFDTLPDMGPIMFNPAGTRAAVYSMDSSAGEYAAFIYDASSWKKLQTLNLTKDFQRHCAACGTSFGGWLPDGNRLFFWLGPGADDPGDNGMNCIVSADGADLGCIPPSAGQLQLSGYTRGSDAPRLLAQSSDGDYFFLDSASETVPPPGAPRGDADFVVITGNDFKAAKQLQLPSPDLLDIVASSSGRYLAYFVTRLTPNSKTGYHLLLKDLQTGAEVEPYKVPPPHPPSVPEPDISVTILGWLEK
jgi:hypothetical protein